MKEALTAEDRREVNRPTGKKARARGRTSRSLRKGNGSAVALWENESRRDLPLREIPHTRSGPDKRDSVMNHYSTRVCR